MYSYRVIDVQLLENSNLPRDVPVDCLGQQTCKCRYFIHFYGPEHKFITFWVNLCSYRLSIEKLPGFTNQHIGKLKLRVYLKEVLQNNLWDGRLIFFLPLPKKLFLSCRNVGGYCGIPQCIYHC